ncbi:sterol methyltransferase [Candidatus Palauibacter sp.]|uniref:sterol methyltransferase n=1 Tax=Candidatus Palauibacter sp. TaxID=3101350 RepID=UPI003AF30197
MTATISGFLRGAIDDGDVEARERRKSEYQNFVKLYFDLVTDFYEYGWNRSFHFASRAGNESLAASLARHEHYLAHMLSLRPGKVALDLGCGIGGPLRQMVRFSGARIVGVSISGYQIERARKQTEEAGLSHMAEYVECDFMKMDFPDASFDAVFSIETTCCAPDKVGIFGEAFRLLKPGGCFGAYEYCLTDRFDSQDPQHLRLKADLELGGGLPDIAYPREVDDALRAVGFELLEARDLAAEEPSGIPWYEPLAGSGMSLANFRSSRFGRVVTHGSVWTLERLRIVPQGTLRVSKLLNMAAAAFAKSGQLGIFTPMYFVLARKPERPGGT